MHLVCLGVVRKVLNLWKSGSTSSSRPNTLGNINVRFSSITVKNVSTNLCEIAKFIPCEFSRKPRSLHELPYWKPTEFRLFLLYLVPVVLQNVGMYLTQYIFLHLMMLHVAMRILASSLYMPSMINYAEDLFKLYVEQFSNLYRGVHISYNVNSLIHLVDDCRVYGVLDNFSAFIFQNSFQSFKRKFKKKNFVLTQLHNCEFENRLASVVGITLNNKCYPKVSKKTSGILLNSIICGQQFKKVETDNFVLKTDLANSCCISFDGSVLVIKSIVQNDPEISLICYKFETITDLYLSPIPSNSIGTYLCRNL